MSKLAELRHLEREVASTKNDHKAAQRALDHFKTANPELVVGQCFIGPLAISTLEDLLIQARSNAKWLAEQCIREGSGAAAVSGEARIVVLLNELCTRLEAR